MKRRPVPREWREDHHDLTLDSRRRYAGRDGSRLANRAGGVCSCGERFGLRADPPRHNMDGGDVREAYNDHVEAAYYAEADAAAAQAKRRYKIGVATTHHDVVEVEASTGDEAVEIARAMNAHGEVPQSLGMTEVTYHVLEPVQS